MIKYQNISPINNEFDDVNLFPPPRWLNSVTTSTAKDFSWEHFCPFASASKIQCSFSLQSLSLSLSHFLLWAAAKKPSSAENLELFFSFFFSPPSFGNLSLIASQFSCTNNNNNMHIHSLSLGGLNKDFHFL